ncbi:MAG: hypothetical protein COB02_01995 [Candidatus Cloacimonadota bacterium]|nr:MAG: hypothetical protein COB02_01995 [Candidatus Cloacimonadota bacterium]
MSLTINDIENVVNLLCVKCHKPLTVDWNIDINKCPYCNDLFKLKSQVHLLLGEKQIELQQKIPFQILQSFPNFNFILICFCVLLTSFCYDSLGLYSILSLSILVVLNIYVKFHKNHKEILKIEKLIELLHQ